MTNSLHQKIALIFLISLTILNIEAYFLIDNRVRYAQNSVPLASELLEVATRSIPKQTISTQQNNYKINQPLTDGIRSLDNEDRELLEEFYRETEARDPFIKDYQLEENSWKEIEDNGLKTLIDVDDTSSLEKTPLKKVKSSSSYHNQKPKSEWTVETDNGASPDLEQVNEDQYTNHRKGTGQNSNIQAARYSPVLKLLTTYNPVEEDHDENRDPKVSNYNVNSSIASREKIIGATLFGHDLSKKPDVNSKSAADAIVLHNDLLKQPPRDGKVRVRMYYHRAIHDDKRLYGTGPWKYWGHGWGLEFGFDPKNQNQKDNFYQKGYSIERAFGRDFCKDKRNCRRPDPDFFKEPTKVGKYRETYPTSTTRMPKYSD